MTNEEIFFELLKWLGGGGVALIGVFLTGKRDFAGRKSSLMDDLQKENEKYYSRMDKQDEKIIELTIQMDEMRKEMFQMQTDKHKSEVKSIELQSKNENLKIQKIAIREEMEYLAKEKNANEKEMKREIEALREKLTKEVEGLKRENIRLKNQIKELMNSQEK